MRVGLTVDLDVDLSGPDDRVAPGLTDVASLMPEVKVQQVEVGLAILRLRPLEEGPVPVRPPPAEGRRVEAARGITGEDQGRAALR